MERIRTVQRSVGGAVTIFCLARGAVGAPSFQGLGDLSGGAFASQAFGVSSDGSTVVGFGTIASGTVAMRWTATAGMVNIGDLPGGRVFAYAVGVSGDGSVIVGQGYGISGYRAFRWTLETGIVDMGVLSGDAESIAMCVSDDGLVIAGFSDEGFSSSPSHAFRWTSGTGMVGLGTLSGHVSSAVYGISMDGLTLVGSGHASNGTSEAIRWTSEDGMTGLGQVRAGAASGAYDANDDGSVIVGIDITDTLDPEAFRWSSDDGMAGLGGLPGAGFVYTIARAVSADGSVIVGTGRIDGLKAMIWTQADGMRLLQDVLTNDYELNLSGWSLEEATGVSGDGRTIVGYGTNPSGFEEGFIAVLAPTPLCIGDITGDGSTNISDFNILASNYSQSVSLNIDGDLDGNGIVNVSDFNILAGDFGCATD